MRLKLEDCNHTYLKIYKKKVNGKNKNICLSFMFSYRHLYVLDTVERLRQRCIFSVFLTPAKEFTAVTQPG